MPAFKSFRKKLRRRRIEGFLLAGYAFAVTCALFLSMLHKPSTTDKPNLPIAHTNADTFDFNGDMLMPAFSDSAADNPFDLAYNQINSLKLLSSNEVITSKFELSQNGKNTVMPLEAKPNIKEQYGEISGIYQKERRVLMVEKGDTFIGLLTKLGMDTKSATEAYNVLRKVFDARNLKVGQHIELTATFDVRSHQLETLDRLVITPERGVKYSLSLDEYDKYITTVEREKFEADVKVVSGSVSGPVVNSMVSAGMPRRLANEVVNRMSHLVNFNRDVHKGDSFVVKYDVSKATNGDVVKIGNLLSATIKTAKNTYKIYRFKDAYYNDKGETKKTGLDIKPLAMRNARISSLFGYRRHPIYKTQKFHNGIDYAAPKGTAIYASGNGVVEMAQYVNGYGNYIKIRHNSEYQTAYGHMNGYAKGIKKGVKVRKGQIIGYVGSTGQSTGPHLHFEILRKGQRINPLKSNVATGNDLYGSVLAEFKNRMRQIDGMKEKIIKKTESAPALASTAAEISKSQQQIGQTENAGKEKKISDAQQAKTSVQTENTIKQAESANNNNELAKADNTLSESQQNADIEKASVNKNGGYSGKIVNPNMISAKEERKKLGVAQQLPAGVKMVKAPARKPRYAKK